MIRRISYHPFFIKLFHWEYWPFHVVYGPLYFYWLWLCLKSRSLFFFSTSNPTISNSGFLMDSKKDIYDLIPKSYYPETIFFQAGVSTEQMLKTMKEHQFDFPLIGKPNIGMKGLSVKKLGNGIELIDYASNSKVDFLIQKFIPYENEVGIFYYRFPDEEWGHISGIVKKEFLAVEGDGTSTILQLLKKDKRFVLQIPTLRNTYGAELNLVIDKGERRVLVPYGNHVRGSKFVDISYAKDGKLRESIDRVCQQIPGFFYGRLDVRFNSWEELREGKSFSIIELNGSGSEPTHIYDPRHSIFFAWKEIIRHWKILWKISRINHKTQKLPYMKFASGVDMFRQNNKYIKMISGQFGQLA